MAATEAPATSKAAAPAVALFYGENPPWDELRAFDVVVVDPDHPGLNPASHQHADSTVFAYASVGEVHASKPYFSRIPPAWLIADNRGWGSRVIDQSAPGWPAFFVEQVLAPLWAQGYRGFFLDTLDSWALAAKTPAEQAKQQAGLVAVIRAIKTRWPEARLIFNRGFEILPQVHDAVWMVAAESLYHGFDPARGGYVDVSTNDRAWLQGKLQQVQKDYGLPILAIDYLPPEKRSEARATAEKIRQLGFIPWVADGGLNTLGVGAVEVLPRKVLVLYNTAESPDLHYADVQRFLGVHFAYLGLVPEYRPISAGPPSFPVTGRYAGIVSWTNSDSVMTGTEWPSWLAARTREGLPLAVFSHFGVGPDDALFKTLGLRERDEPLPANVMPAISAQDPMMGFEMPLRARRDDLTLMQMQDKKEGRALLTLRLPDAQEFQSAAIMPWGGYVLAPYVLESLPGNDNGERWYVNPVAFLRTALRLDGRVPVPDVTTENGRRLFLSHIDGDGFASDSEFSGRRNVGVVLRDDILKRYRLPTTMSVIEGEVGPTGLYPKRSAEFEKTARDIFALPFVEVASHTYSHPFFWSKAEAAAAAGEGDAGGYHLDIKGYNYNIEREIKGSRDYINNRLAPKDKKTEILLWSGNCVATPAALAEVASAGLLNMNGGETTITKSRNSWTRMAGLGIEKGGYFQVFAPNQNENVYTNLWTGPFYGFDRVIETFELTDTPYRFKPVNLYYHSYAVSKSASLASMHRIYGWVEKQPLHPVFASDYIRMVLDYNSMVVARTPEGFRIRGDGNLRNLRISAPDKSQPDWQASTGLAGVADAPEGKYLALVNGNADISFSTVASKNFPWLASANARLGSFQRDGRNLRFGLAGQVPLEFALGGASSCELRAAGKIVKPVRSSAGLNSYKLDQHAEPALELRCRP
ncbi:MAG: bifunctional glycoside hydrolase 114/ polysaccharide deacetylase family protein [Pedobacter sp.]|nr:bifunctional glycoside hydrolase 114/ polysaccharide deacetylase family protein [Pedobacter sp.]